MNQKFLVKTALASSFAVTSFASVLSSQPTQAQTTRNIYSCIENNGVPTTVVDTKRGRIELIVWKSDYFRASGWTPEKRCQEVTTRFQKFSDGGTLRYVTTGKINSQKVICVGKPIPGQGISCIGDSLLITLQPEDNPDEVLRNLFSNAARVGGTPVTRDPEGRYVFPMSDYLETAPVMSSSQVSEVNIPPVDNPPSTETNQDNGEVDNCGFLCE